MPYYISPQSTVVVLPPGRTAGADHHLIDPVAAAEYGLEHGQALSDEVLAAVLADDAIAFAAATGREVRTMPDGTIVRHAVDRILPEEGRWEYIVRPLTELGGFATAKGTASRMEEVLNSLAGQGWELVTTSERDARWMGGETVILVLRRYVVTEAMFVVRFTAEEQLRRRVMRDLSTSEH